MNYIAHEKVKGCLDDRLCTGYRLQEGVCVG